jgi:hypothetical protein
VTIDDSVKATPIPALGNAQTAFEFRIVAAIFNFSLTFRQPLRRRETFGDESNSARDGADCLSNRRPISVEIIGARA